VGEIVVEMPGNWHRVFDHRRAQRPAILRHPGDNPLHRIAAVVASVGEAADALADYARRQEWPSWVAELADILAGAAGDVANWLLILAGKLDENLGPAWAEHMGLPLWHL
jgi:NTP pyrophosphatase (non-canonical NTP hydrolase)